MPQAQASTAITFDAGTPNLYFAGEGLSESGFRMTTEYDFGTVDKAAALGEAAPSGNATQFYFNSNDGDLLVNREDGASFSLDGFSAAFIPLIPSPGPAQTPVIVALGVTDSGDRLATYFGLGSSETNSHPFITFNNSAGDFTRFSRLSRVTFFHLRTDRHDLRPQHAEQRPVRNRRHPGDPRARAVDHRPDGTRDAGRVGPGMEAPPQGRRRSQIPGRSHGLTTFPLESS